MRASSSILLFVVGVMTHLVTSAHGAMCSNGLAGVQTDEVCCVEECGTCGGVGCSQRPGGPLGCCMTELRDLNERCSVYNEAPCIIDDGPVDSEDFSYDLDTWYDDDSADDGMWCTGGIPGVESPGGEACCPMGCGQCGGVGCSRFGKPELDSYDCCITEIMDLGESCAATGQAPCYYDDSN